MTDLVRWFNEEVEKGELTALELASLFHYRYIRIHPFEDGNGRISRLLVNYILHKFDYPMIIIKSEDKANYLRALRQSDINSGLLPSDGANATIEDIEPFLEYMKQQLEYSLNISIRAAKGESIDESGDWKKKMKLKLKSLEEAPLFSDAIAKKIAKESMHFLAEKINVSLEEYEQLFTSCAGFIGYKSGDRLMVLKSLELLEKFDYSSDWKLLLTYNKTVKAINSKFIVCVNCDFHERDYLITLEVGEERCGLTKKYNEFITEDDANNMLDFVGNLFYDFVSTNIIKNE